jgi:hypothetical protein
VVLLERDSEMFQSMVRTTVKDTAMLCPVSFSGWIRDVDEESPSTLIERRYETKQIKAPL